MTSQQLVVAFTVATSALTLWSYVRWPGAAPATMKGAIVRVLLAVALLVGYRTRLATIGSWILLASIHVRLPVVINAGDTLLRVLLFWSIFLPLGAMWSVDARRGRPVAAPG